jgi:YbbR domain-containing protein
MIAFLHDLIHRDFWLKLLSLVLAILIWLTVSFAISKEVSPLSAFSSHEPEQSYFNVPVLVILSAADVREVRVDPGEVQVTVQAEPKALLELKPREIRAQVDLTGIESTRGLRKRIEVILPSGITLSRVVPDEVEVIVPPRK